MRYLLDTNVVIWLMTGNRAVVPDHVAQTIASSDVMPYVSAASVWEIAIKRSLGKLRIEDHWRRVLMGLDLEHLPVTAEHAAMVEQLPWIHRDPFDRLLIAQAMAEDCSFVTADRVVASYSLPTLWA